MIEQSIYCRWLSSNLCLCQIINTTITERAKISTTTSKLESGRLSEQERNGTEKKHLGSWGQWWVCPKPTSCDIPNETIGVSGLVFIQAALKQKNVPQLTLFVRTASKIPATISANTNVRIVEGSLSNDLALEDAMTDVNTVVSFLGAYISLNAAVMRTKTTPIADSFPTVFRAMRAKGVKRILALSTPAFLLPEDQLSWKWYMYLCIPPAFAPQGNAEMAAIAKQLAAQSDLDWTVFRIPHLNDGAADLPMEAGALGPQYRGTTELSRASMVRWVLKEIEQGNWVKDAPVLGNY